MISLGRNQAGKSRINGQGDSALKRLSKDWHDMGTGQVRNWVKGRDKSGTRTVLEDHREEKETLS